MFEGTNKAKILLIFREGGTEKQILSGQQELWHYGFPLRGVLIDALIQPPPNCQHFVIKQVNFPRGNSRARLTKFITRFLVH